MLKLAFSTISLSINCTGGTKFIASGTWFDSIKAMFVSKIRFMSHQAFQYNNSSIQSATFSWVYIVYRAVSKELNIGLSFNLTKQIDSADSVEKLVYYRSFRNPFDAVAHKHLLDSLSSESVMHKVKEMNPKLKNLSQFMDSG